MHDTADNLTDNELDELIVRCSEEAPFKAAISRCFFFLTYVLCTRHLKKNANLHFEEYVGYHLKDRQISKVFEKNGLTDTTSIRKTFVYLLFVSWYMTKMLMSVNENLYNISKINSYLCFKSMSLNQRDRIKSHQTGRTIIQKVQITYWKQRLSDDCVIYLNSFVFCIR